MGRMARMGAAVALALVAGAIAAGPAGALLAPVHNRGALKHAIHQKQKELARVQAQAHAYYEGWLRVLAHRDQQKRNLLARWETNAVACQAAARCGDARRARAGEEEGRLGGEIQADEKLAAGPEPGEAKYAIRAYEHAHELEEQIKQREAELALLLSLAPAAKR